MSTTMMDSMTLLMIRSKLIGLLKLIGPCIRFTVIINLVHISTLNLNNIVSDYLGCLVIVVVKVIL